MRLPTVSQYIESLESPFGLFRTLGDFEVERDMYDEIKVRAGNNAAVFKIFCRQEPMMLKCYIKSCAQARNIYRYVASLDSPLLASVKLLEDEMFVFNFNLSGNYHDVLVGQWSEGTLMEVEIRRSAARGDSERLGRLAAAFDAMALELLECPWAHGDLKPENIILSPDGRLRLIDYDAIYFPGGKPTGEIGTTAYQHPLRDEHMYDKHVDDYSIAIISASLRLLSADPSLYAKYNRSDNILFDPIEIFAGLSPLYAAAVDQSAKNGDIPLFRLLFTLKSPTPHIEAIAQVISAPTGATPPATELTPTEEGRYSGYVDSHGAMLIPAIFERAAHFHDDLAAVVLGGYNHFIDPSGRVAINCSEYPAINSFSEGLAAVESGGLWGYIDREGRMAIRPIFEVACSMRGGMAAVKVDGFYGFIDREGNMVIEPQFDYVMNFNGRYAQVKKGEIIAQIDKMGREVLISD